jgi:hypothetical protein
VSEGRESSWAKSNDSDALRATFDSTTELYECSSEYIAFYCNFLWHDGIFWRSIVQVRILLTQIVFIRGKKKNGCLAQW